MPYIKLPPDEPTFHCFRCEKRLTGKPIWAWLEVVIKGERKMTGKRVPLCPDCAPKIKVEQSK